MTLVQPTATTSDDTEAYIGPAANAAPNRALTGNISLSGALRSTRPRTTRRRSTQPISPSAR